MVVPHPPSAVDVVVVGAGAAGCLYAARLARAGKRVAVLESGPAWQMRDLYSSQIWGRRLKWRGPLMNQPPGPPIFSQTHATGSGFGGAALHHFGTWLRLRQPDFKFRSQHGQGLDWPMDYDDLRIHYDSIQKEMGIAGDAIAESSRPPGEAYPMPPHRLFKQARLLERGFAAKGMATAPLPLAINSTVYRGKPACLYDGWCEAGCPIGALANPLVTHLAMAQHDGATFHAETTVTRVLTDASRKVTGIECMYRGTRRIVRASVVILAASVIENPRLLLNSGTAITPGGLANSSGLVGAFFNVDAVAIAYGMFAEDTENHMGVNAGQLLFRGDHAGPDRPGIVGAYQWQIAPSLKPNDLLGIATSRVDLFGQPLHDFMLTASRKIASMAGFAGSVPERDNRIVLDTTRDENGVPRARLTYRVAPNTQALWEHLLREGKAVMSAAGAKDVWTGPMAGGHLFGGTIMGSDPKHSVCDGYGRTHDVRNLVLAGGGLFPGGSGTSPTFTIYAIAERSAAHMLAHWDDYAQRGARH